jgi:hypothetical protein
LWPILLQKSAEGYLRATFESKAVPAMALNPQLAPGMRSGTVYALNPQPLPPGLTGYPGRMSQKDRQLGNFKAHN